MKASKKKVWMITLHEQWVKLFVQGEKRIELRTRVPKALRPSDVILVAQSETNNKVVIRMTVVFIIKLSPTDMFNEYAKDIQVNYIAYNDYTKGRDWVYGIWVCDVEKLDGDLHTSDFGIDNAPRWFREVRK